MFLNEEIEAAITEVIKNALGTGGQFKVIGSVSGGSINQCFQVEFSQKQYFLKINSSSAYPDMLSLEAKGLKEMAETKTIKVPEPVGAGEIGDTQFIVLNWVKAGRNSIEGQHNLGFQLSELHKINNSYFGLDYDNYMGALRQFNTRSDDFSTFFIESRLIPQLDISISKNLINTELRLKFDKVFNVIKDIKCEKPSFVHGDLWSGNYLIDEHNQPVLIDPAIAFSNRETDIAMTTLFGGFNSGFYEAYNENYPLADGWEERLDLWNLYPLLIHLNLFGSGYLRQIEFAVNKYI